MLLYFPPFGLCCFLRSITSCICLHESRPSDKGITRVAITQRMLISKDFLAMHGGGYCPLRHQFAPLLAVLRWSVWTRYREWLWFWHARQNHCSRSRHRISIKMYCAEVITAQKRLRFRCILPKAIPATHHHKQHKYSNPSLSRTPLIRNLDNPDKFWQPENFQVIFTPISRIPATSRPDNADTFPADIDWVRE